MQRRRGPGGARVMARSQTIYVDMDDVLCETARRFLLIIEREFGRCVPYEDLTNFNLEHSCGLSPAERTELHRIVHQRDEISSIEPMADGIAVVKGWAAAGYEIAIVTGRPPDAYEPSVDWLTRHDIPYHSFTVVDKYGRFQTENTIGLTLSELASREYCWAVEDSLPVAQFLAREMKVPVALLDRPWNREEISHTLITRCDNWQAISLTSNHLPK